MSLSAHSSVLLPKQGDEIFVLFNTSESSEEVTNEPFKAFIVSCIPDFSRNQEVLANGSIHYWQTKDWEASTHAVKFLTGRRVQSVFSTQQFDAQPTPWAYNLVELMSEDVDEDTDFNLNEVEAPNAGNPLESLVTGLQSDVERTSMEINSLKHRIRSLETMLVNPQEQLMSSLAEHVRNYITASLMCEFSKSLKRNRRRSSRTKSIQDEFAIETGPLTCNFVEACTPCSFLTFEKVFNEFESSIMHHQSHKPVFYPSRPRRSFRGPMHSEYFLICPSLFAFCIAIGMSNDDIRKNLLWTQRDGRLRIAGAFTAGYIPSRSPGFVLPGFSSISISDLGSTEEHRDHSSPISITTARISTTEEVHDENRFRHAFIKQKLTVSRNTSFKPSFSLNPHNSFLITWRISKSLNQGMTTTSDVLGELKVSVPTVSSSSDFTIEQLSSLFSDEDLKSIVTI